MTGVERIVTSFPVTDATRSAPLGDLCRELYGMQLMVWREFAEAYAACQATWCREVTLADETVLVQLNPLRTASSAAPLDAATVASRPCFLCLSNLPREQKAILYRDDYLILCNPRPLFAPHFTVSHREHRPQDLRSGLTAFLALSKDLAPAFHVFYNGPHCGASAPDHLHFQVYPRGALPVDAYLKGGDTVVAKEGVEISVLSLTGRGALKISGAEAEVVAAATVRCLGMPLLQTGDADEPLVNVIGGYDGGLWSLLVFPRRRGRPAIYYRPEGERMVISPGAVEMGGMFVTVTEGDFTALNARTVQAIYEEVAIDAGTLREMIPGL